MSLYHNKYRVESIRLKNYDYTKDGSYFITICTDDRLPLFGNIRNGLMEMNEYGIIVTKCWNDLPNHYPNLILDEFVIMPNHIHGIMIIDNKRVGYVETGLRPVSTNMMITTPPKKNIHGLPEFIRALKSFSTRRINKIRNTHGKTIWQRNYYDRIIRNEDELNRTRQYLINNPAKWKEDRHYNNQT